MRRDQVCGWLQQQQQLCFGIHPGNISVRELSHAQQCSRPHTHATLTVHSTRLPNSYQARCVLCSGPSHAKSDYDSSFSVAKNDSFKSETK